ncbi:hypothetical protein Tco_1424187 [Tanacetum coccineum]
MVSVGGWWRCRLLDDGSGGEMKVVATSGCGGEGGAATMGDGDGVKVMMVRMMSSVGRGGVQMTPTAAVARIWPE